MTQTIPTGHDQPEVADVDVPADEAAGSGHGSEGRAEVEATTEFDAAAEAGSGATPAGVQHRVSRAAAWTMIIASVIGTLASVTLIMEKLATLINPAHVPSCSLNPIISCGSVFNSEQASLFWDLPNPVLGVIGFPMVLTTAVALLAGARFRGWYWGTLLAGIGLGVVFIHWLAYQSIYNIGALCLYCMVVWVATMSILAATVVQLSAMRKVPRALALWAPSVVLIWIVAVAVAIFVHFSDYWLTLL